MLHHILLFSFNRNRTYQAELSKGSDQEKASYILTAKRKVVKLVCHWVALYDLLLKEDPVALDFLEVRLQSPLKKENDVDFISGFNQRLLYFFADQQRLKKEVAADYRLSGILKEQFRERRRTRM